MRYLAAIQSGCLTLSAACERSFEARASAACGRCAATRAGYDGFWLHRVLVNHGIENHVLDAASLPIDRRAKHIKTDNIDAKRLLRAIVGFVQGDPQSCRA